jgi:hypothetical protein
LKKNDTPQYSWILIVIAIINIIFSTSFISIFLAGVVFKIFLESLKKQYYYILTFSIFTFLIIEVVQGFQPFLLTAIALFLYYFIIPRIKHTFSSSIMSEFIFIFLFYLMIFIVSIFYMVFNINILYIFIYNFVIDIILVGFFI